MKRLTWLLFGAYFLQADVVIFLRFQAPGIAALHPVLALVDFALGVSLARRAWPLAMRIHAPVSMGSDLEHPLLTEADCNTEYRSFRAYRLVGLRPPMDYVKIRPPGHARGRAALQGGALLFGGI